MHLEEKPKILLVGASGQQGQEYYQLLKDEFHISAVVDSNFEELNSLYKKEKNLSLYSDTAVALEHEDFQVAIVCVPHDTHFSVTMSLLK
ncbi:MAG: Gfo/Idh/MocA family oxidoreductase, partial [bacterium]